MVKRFVLFMLVVVLTAALSSCASISKHGLPESDYHALRVKIVVAHGKRHTTIEGRLPDDRYATAKADLFYSAATLKGEPVHYRDGQMIPTISDSEMIVRLCDMEQDLHRLMQSMGRDYFYRTYPASATEKTLAFLIAEYRLAIYTGQLQVDEQAAKKLRETKAVFNWRK